MYDVIVIGSGPAGFTSAIYTCRSALRTLLITGSEWGGQLMLTTLVENFPGFPDGILGQDLMQKMRSQVEKLGAAVIDKNVLEVDFSQIPFVIKTSTSQFKAKSVIIATGANTKWLNVEGESRLIGKGVSSCAPCDAFFFKNKRIVVVGGGDSAAEEALVLSKFASSVVLVHRREELRAAEILQKRLFNNSKISFCWNSQAVEILGKEKVTGVKILTTNIPSSTLNKEGKTIMSFEELVDYFGGKLEKEVADGWLWNLDIDGVFVAIGHVPNTKFFEGKVDLDEKGFVKRFEIKDNRLVKYFTMTSVEGVFVAGDVHDYRYKQAITASGFGCMAAMDVEKWLEEKGFLEDSSANFA